MAFFRKKAKPQQPVEQPAKKEKFVYETCESCNGKGFHVYYPSTSRYDWHPSDVDDDWGRSEESGVGYRSTINMRNLYHGLYFSV